MFRTKEYLIKGKHASSYLSGITVIQLGKVVIFSILFLLMETLGTHFCQIYEDHIQTPVRGLPTL